MKKNLVNPDAVPRWHGRIPITITLAAAIGLLVLVTVGVVFGVGVWIAQKNTFDLLNLNAQQTVAAEVNQFEQHLRPSENLTRFLAERISRGEVDPANKEQFSRMLIGALAGVQQVEVIGFIDTQLQSTSARRERELGSVIVSNTDQSSDPVFQSLLGRVSEGAVWGPPAWREEIQRSYLYRAHPVRRNGELIGAMVAVTSIEGLSTFISEHGIKSAGNSFILYGRDEVLAHWLLIDGYPNRSSEYPLPSLSRFGDPVLASIWQPAEPSRNPNKPVDGIQTHLLELFNDSYVYVYRSLKGFGPEPMIIGAYFQANNSVKEIRRMFAALVAGIVALLISLIAAIILGHRIARPIVRFSAAAGQIRELDVSQIEDLPGSMLRELNDQSIAFNTMLRALRWFELYVPKKIVERLIRQADVRDTISDAREITVMFTDIAGFTSVSEGMLAPEVAAFVNHHFSLLADCIEAEEGTIDKFMGDAVMAFWGAPDEQTDSAERACRAALAIASTIHEDNKQRLANGEQAVDIRIGIHTGMATVGNIGAPGRLNYTVIGDTVNIGQRLEQLGKEIYPTHNKVSILVSDKTAIKLSSAFTLAAAGNHKLKGRQDGMAVFEIVTDIA
ncbi:adenylate/guanylate cyclase domain-containing protein [Granulosicoccus antarcticus]|uniref:adenylate/guanylate cyclase domain-containing protein n=1 Tax=Granulosicoccus antarcticus TaxID=437505 RepID=UPI00146FA60E|nr:adenylate/guanylate cyclase domain-containing protein [Granulosicoccus antarcticus]